MKTGFAWAIVGLLSLPVAGFGQAPADSSDEVDTTFLRELSRTRGFMLGRPSRARPTPDGKAVLFLRSQVRTPSLSLFEFDVANAKTREVLTPEQILKGAAEKLTPEEKARRERMRVSVRGLTNYQLSEDGTRLLVNLSGKLYVVNRQSSEVMELKTGRGPLLDPHFAPHGKAVAYVRDYDVYVYDLAAAKENRVTTGGTEKLSHGLAEFVAQEEMARYSGYWWSPDSEKIVYQESDASGVETWYVKDPFRPGQLPRASFYPRPGEANVKVRLGIVAIKGGPTMWIQWDSEHYPYLARVNWTEYGPLTIAVQTRDQKELALLQVNPADGTTRRLLAETDAAWVNIPNGVPRWLEGDAGFLWISETQGGPHLELRGSNGELTRVLVPASAGFQHLVDFNVKTGAFFFNASVDPTQSQVFRATLDQPKPMLMSHGAGMHSISVAKNGEAYVAHDSSSDAMPSSVVFKADGTRVGELPSVAKEPPFKPCAEVVKVGEGGGFYATIIHPHQFDAKKRYPVIVDVYGGPGINHVSSTMGSHFRAQWLADQGFIVVSVDGRGTPHRGRDWERAIYQKFGSVPLADQITALEALRGKYPEMDMDRVGIVGWSFGGYMSALAVLQRPDWFKAAVAGAPVVDWMDYDTHYTERYLGVPPAAAAAYKEGSLLTYVKSQKELEQSYGARSNRPLLIVHGTADDNVYFRHSLRLADALLRAGRPFEFLPLAGFTHMVPDPAVSVQLWSRVVRHFRKHLGKPREF